MEEQFLKSFAKEYVEVNEQIKECSSMEQTQSVSNKLDNLLNREIELRMIIDRFLTDIAKDNYYGF